jgi:hypothetical protein
MCQESVYQLLRLARLPFRNFRKWIDRSQRQETAGDNPLSIWEAQRADNR